MNNGPIVRKRKTQKEYLKHIRSKSPTAACLFCIFPNKPDEIIHDCRYFWVVKNIFGYDVWDNQEVAEHLMIVPKRHIEGLHELEPEEQREYFRIVSKYEKESYSLYARAPKNTSKSIPHQHSHLIKMNDKHYKFILYSSSPHITLYK